MIVVSRSSTASWMRRETLGVVDPPHRRLQRQADREELLDDRVVEVHRDALAILDQHHVAHARVQPGVVDCDTGGRSQRDHELLVDVGEGVLGDACR